MTNTQHTKPDSDGLAYVRINQNGKVIAVFSDNSEMDVNELFTLSIMDD
ncbi:MAG: hypothetical protein OEX03_04795 [Gammaproteobacteria bacterium]|nr:hypothetical protein [Gammaproteobacteria bacterium]